MIELGLEHEGSSKHQRDTAHAHHGGKNQDDQHHSTRRT